MNRMFISPATGRTGPHALGLALAALGAALLLMPTLALAHGSGKGAGSFFSGAVHPLREPAHALALMTLGLWTGQRGIDESHPSLPCFGLALLLCLWLASTGINLDVDFALYVAAATMGIAVAISMKVPTLMRASVAGLVGAGIGLGSRPDGLVGAALTPPMSGTAFGACLWLLNAVALAALMQRPVWNIGVRVLGSWLAASALLVMALSLAGRPV
jgi:hydrogenase/urease accessory protein HupE